jgi:hypothetical protein
MTRRKRRAVAPLAAVADSVEVTLLPGELRLLLAAEPTATMRRVGSTPATLWVTPGGGPLWRLLTTARGVDALPEEAA